MKKLMFYLLFIVPAIIGDDSLNVADDLREVENLAQSCITPTTVLNNETIDELINNVTTLLMEHEDPEEAASYLIQMLALMLTSTLEAETVPVEPQESSTSLPRIKRISEEISKESTVTAGDQEDDPASHIIAAELTGIATNVATILANRKNARIISLNIAAMLASLVRIITVATRKSPFNTLDQQTIAGLLELAVQQGVRDYYASVNS